MYALRSFLACIVVLAAASQVFALGGDYTGKIGGSDKWPEGLKELANRPNRVHGYFINWQDFLSYIGSMDELNDFLEKYARLPNTKLEVVLHPGSKMAGSPWAGPEKATPADWQLYASPFAIDQVQGDSIIGHHRGKLDAGRFITRVDVWLGSLGDISNLKVPANIKVESGGEIEGFVARHRDVEAKTGDPR